MDSFAMTPSATRKFQIARWFTSLVCPPGGGPHSSHALLLCVASRYQRSFSCLSSAVVGILSMLQLLSQNADDAANICRFVPNRKVSPTHNLTTSCDQPGTAGCIGRGTKSSLVDRYRPLQQSKVGCPARLHLNKNCRRHVVFFVLLTQA